LYFSYLIESIHDNESTHKHTLSKRYDFVDVSTSSCRNRAPNYGETRENRKNHRVAKIKKRRKEPVRRQKADVRNFARLARRTRVYARTHTRDFSAPQTLTFSRGARFVHNSERGDDLLTKKINDPPNWLYLGEERTRFAISHCTYVSMYIHDAPHFAISSSTPPRNGEGKKNTTIVRDSLLSDVVCMVYT
jgi:hypothetical protein